MRRISTALISLVCVLSSLVTAHGQSAPADPTVTVPRLIRVAGVFQPVDTQPSAGVEVVTVSIYAESDGGLPVWQERQSVTVDKTGRFTLLLGASYPDGIPADVFGSGQAQWMSLLFERVGEVEQPRARIASVPYSLKASDAETLGGLPASAYLRAPMAEPTSVVGRESSLAVPATDPPITADVLPGTTNFLAKYVNGVDVGNSAVYETGGAVGIGTTTPLDQLHVRFTNTNGAFTGLAVQNLGGTTTSFSGMLFYDQNGALGQFQGFSNGTHEYRINNIARVSPGGAFNGSINFMTGSTSRFFIAPNGNIGIGTAAPITNLEVSNAIAATGTGNVTASTFSANNSGSLFAGRKARGTAAAPTAIMNGDQLAFFGGQGYTGTAFAANASGMRIVAAENWTPSQQGSEIQFSTTERFETTPVVRMTLDHRGDLEVRGMVNTVKESSSADIVATHYSGDPDEDPQVKFETHVARGTVAAPVAVQAGDWLGFFSARGYDGTGFGENIGMGVYAAENFTDTAQGAGIVFSTLPLGTNDDPIAAMILEPDGDVGIGAFTSFPTISDRLQVVGDIRVGTSGTNGCLKNFAGAGIIGTCSSDRRFKKDITPFRPVLDQLTALQPVHYFWRAADFPKQQFGDSRAYGLIAQDVEQVLPELVVTNEDGFKAVDYTKLPLLTIQAVKELKAENDALKQRVTENDALKQRVEELERLVAAMLTAAAHR